MCRKRWIVLLLSLMVLSLAACQQTDRQKGEELVSLQEVQLVGELLLGVMVPVTGGEATYGRDMENAIKIALDEINAQGGLLGRRVIYTLGNSACDSQMAIAAANELVSREVVSVVGGYCAGATLSTLKIYGDAKIPMVIPAANSTKIAEENPGWSFQINVTDFHQAAKAVEWFRKLGAETISLIHMGDSLSAELADMTKNAWEAVGKEVVTSHVVNRGEQDFSALVTKIKSENPDGIYWTAYVEEGAPLVKQLRQGGYRGEIMVSDGSRSVKFLELAGNASEGVYCTAPPRVEFLPIAQDFIAEYVFRYNQLPGPYAGLAYDATYLLAAAIEKAGSINPDEIRQALEETDRFPTLAGPVSFTPEKTLIESNFVILKAQGGTWVLAE